MLAVERMLEPFSPENTELMLAVQASPHGQALATEIRYDRYCFIAGNEKHADLPWPLKQEVAHIWAEEWLDADVNNLQHMPFTALMGQYACRLDGLDDETTNRVVRALLVHDLSEAKMEENSDGDVTYDDDHARGHDGFKRDHHVLTTMLRSGHFPLNEAEIVEIQADMDDSKREGTVTPETVEGQQIEIAERLGYIHAGISAFAVAEGTDGLSRQEYLGLLWMAENCFSNSLPRLIDLAPDYPSVMTFLKERKRQIAQTFGGILRDVENIFDMYCREGKNNFHIAERKNKCGKAFEAWFANGGTIPGIHTDASEQGIFS